MSFNPIDVLRTQELSQYKHMENQRMQHAQDESSKNFQTLLDNRNNKPVEATKSDHPEYRYDAKEKGSNQYYGSGEKKKKKKEEEKKESKNPPQNGHLDIRI